MTSNFAARAATAGELTKFRSAGQRALLGLAIKSMPTVYTMQVNQTFETLDGLAELTYDNGSGTLSDVLPGMTIFVGSTAGARDKGLLRVRKAPTADTLYIGQVSDVVFADDDHLTVVDDFQLWQRDIITAGGVALMDYDIPFGSYTNGGATNRVGPIAAVLKLSGGSVTFNPPDPSGSACYDGATVSSYLYAAPGAATTSDMDTSTPEWTYDTAGQYRWSCTITDSLGRETTSYRWIFVNPDPFDFELGACFGDYQSGYWQFTVTCFSDATTDDIHERALVTLYADEEYYGGVAGSIGKIAGYENILCVGWIDGESIVRDPDVGTVTFTVRGPGYWLGEMRAFPFEIQHTSSAPASWKELEDLTVDKALAHVLFWMSTATLVMDCYFSGDTTQKQIITEPGGSLMDQLNNIALNNIFAKALVNNYGQLYVEIDPQIADSTARSGFPVVMDLTDEVDYLGSLDIQRQPSSRASMVELAGYESYDGVSIAQIYARAPGNSPKRLGDFRSYNNYIFADQDECNRVAGALLAFENNEYEPLDVDLSANNRLFDIAPRMVATLSLAAGDTPRGVALNAQRLIPRRVELDWDKNNSVLVTKATFEFETAGLAVDGVTYVPPVITDSIPDLSLGGFGSVDFPDTDLGGWFPSEVPPEVETDCAQNKSNQFNLNWDLSVLKGDDSTKLIARAYFPCYVRSTFLTTTLLLNGFWYGDAPTRYGVYGIKGGSRILTAAVSTFDHNNVATFSPLSDTLVDGFEIALEAGLGSEVQYTPGSALASGSVDATNESGESESVEAGQYYAIDTIGGPFVHGEPAGGQSVRSQISLNGSTWYINDSIGGPIVSVVSLGSAGLPDDPDYPPAIYGIYYRAFLLASGSLVYFRVEDSTHFDTNSGSLGYILRAANAIGRQINLAPFTLKNVCTQI